MSNEDEVGYKKPPKKSQFKKGKSGNPRGRPRKAVEDDTFGGTLTAILREKVTVIENNIPTEMRRQEALIRFLLNNTLQGHPTSMRVIEGFLNKNVIPKEERMEEKAAAKKVNLPKPKNAIEAARYYKQMIKSL